MTSLANNYDLALPSHASNRRASLRPSQIRVLSRHRLRRPPTYGHNQFINSPASNSAGAQGFFLAIARASWEADVWGRIRRTNEAARAQ